MKKLLLLVLLVFCGITFSCKDKGAKKETETQTQTVEVNEGDKLLGLWADTNTKWGKKMEIVKDGSSYLVKITYTRGNNKDREYLADYKDGALKMGNSMIPDVKYSESQDKIYWGGATYERK